MRNTHTAEGTRTFNRENAEKIVAYWQERLRLGEWRFAVEVLDDLGDNRGEFCGDVYYRQGVIRLIPPEKYERNEYFSETEPDWYRWERTIVHELLHAVLFPLTHGFAKGSCDNVLEEHVVMALSEALMAERYGK